MKSSRMHSKQLLKIFEPWKKFMIDAFCKKHYQSWKQRQRRNGLCTSLPSQLLELGFWIAIF